MNRIILIGPVGDKRAYLNVSRADAIERYTSRRDFCDPPLEAPGFVQEFEFEDEFWTYGAGCDE